MSWFLTALLCVLLVELALRLPFAATVAALSRAGARAVHVVRAESVSDHWKEKALAAYAQTTFLSSLKLAGLLLLLVALATLAVVALDPIFDGFQRFLLGWRGIGFSIVFASVYLTLRKSILHGRL